MTDVLHYEALKSLRDRRFVFFSQGESGCQVRSRCTPTLHHKQRLRPRDHSRLRHHRLAQKLRHREHSLVRDAVVAAQLARDALCDALVKCVSGIRGFFDDYFAAVPRIHDEATPPEHGHTK